MKYLEDDSLTKWTAALTDVRIDGSGSGNTGLSGTVRRHLTHERVLFGRMEAYIMTRTASEKEYAYALGAKYVEEMEKFENEWVKLQQLQKNDNLSISVPSRKSRKRSQSAGSTVEAMLSPAKPSKIPRRPRAVSIDLGSPAAASYSNPPESSMSSSSSSCPVIPKSTALGDFMEMRTRRLMTDLILTLHASFPDYDFEEVRANHFVKLHLPEVHESINQRLMQWALQQAQSSSPSGVLKDMWESMDQVIQLGDCQVYSYVPPPRDTDDDPLSFLTETLVGDLLSGDYDEDENNSGESPSSMVPLWSLNYFFVNNSLKRILVFTCVEVVRCLSSNAMSDDDFIDEDRTAFCHIADAATASGDFDLDPASDVAGGIPVTTV